MSTLKNIAIAFVLLGGTAYLTYAYRKRLLRILCPQLERETVRGEKVIGNAMTDVCQAFLMYADIFQGLYEPIYKASIGSISQERMKNILMEWDIRISNISQAPISLKSWWTTIVANSENLAVGELKNRANSVVQMILSAGIIRDDRHELVASQDTIMYYQNSEDEDWQNGQKFRVESACWYKPGNPVRIIEKGYCEII